MDRSTTSHLFSLLLFPVAAILALSALTLPLQPYTGVALQGDRVATIEPGSPGQQAGLAPGDVLAASPRSLISNPLSAAVPERPLPLEIRRGSERRVAWLAPVPLPDGERRLHGALLAVACGFLLLGGWVWSERRDRLTRTFLLLCLAFTLLLVPPPHLASTALTLTHEVIQAAAAAFLAALCIHFFAQFPGSRQVRGGLGALVAASYIGSLLLFAAALTVLGLRSLGRPGFESDLTLLAAAGGVWFAAGLLIALGLFVRSYLRAASGDARRRLRVALVGTIFGAAPITALIAVRSLSPGTEVPGERGAVLLTLLVPASFAWATVVHRVFDFRVALRAVVATTVLAFAGAGGYVVGQWIADGRWPGFGAGMAGGSLALLAMGAALAGPASPWLRSFAAGRDADDRALGVLAAPPGGRDENPLHLLEWACDALARALRLDGCAALVSGPGGPELAATCGALGSFRPRDRFAPRLSPGAPVAVDEADLDASDREALERAGVGWLLPAGGGPLQSVILLGRRIAGPWLSRRESAEIEDFAARLDVSLENAELRRAASSHGALDRALREAGAIQAHLLPRHAPAYPTLDCAAAALLSEPVGGDYYDFVETAPRTFTLAVGDAAGRGMPAALVLAGVQARFRHEARLRPNPGDVLRALNLELVDLDQPEKFVGLLCARVEASTGRLCVANAGVTPPLVRRRRGSFEEYTAGGVLLGVSATADYPEDRVELRAGDVALLYTDGLTEARRGDEMFGVGRVRRALDAHAHRRAADILAGVLDAVRSFADRPLDDLTVVVLKQLTDPATARAATPQNALKWRAAAADDEG